MKKVLIRVSFILAVLITLSVLLYPTVSDYVNSLSQSRVVAQYFDDVAGMEDAAVREMLETARKYNAELAGKRDRFAYTDEDTAVYRLMLNTGRGVMGILSVDKIGVKLPIYHGTDEGVLQVGLGHMQGSSLPVGGAGTHCIITGHRGLPSSTLLTNLDRMAEGDLFVLYIMGETLTYQVDNIKTVKPDEVRSLDIDREMDYCTLVTCTPYGINSHRMLVRGHRVENIGLSDWEAVYAGAKRVDSLITLLILLIPLIPVLIIYAIIKCWKIKAQKVRN